MTLVFFQNNFKGWIFISVGLWHASGLNIFLSPLTSGCRTSKSWDEGNFRTQRSQAYNDICTTQHLNEGLNSRGPFVSQIKEHLMEYHRPRDCFTLFIFFFPRREIDSKLLPRLKASRTSNTEIFTAECDWNSVSQRWIN